MSSSRPSARHESPASRAQVYGHRGAPAFFPEHTLASYARAIADGADFIEPDLVMSRDGVMVSRHENEIGSTTDVADHPQFAARRTTRTIDGQDVTGWFTEDFTLDELKTLRARERLPELRGTAHDGCYSILTLEEIIDFVAAESQRLGRVIGIVPEIKHGTYFRTRNLAMEDRLLATLDAHDYTRKAPVEIQSFEVGNLVYLRERIGDGTRRHASNLRLLQLLDSPDRQAFDVRADGGTSTYADMMSPAGLRAVALYADAIGPSADAVIPRTSDDRLGQPTALVRHAHDAGLRVHPYTFRPENRFLAREFRNGNGPDRANTDGLVEQIRRFLDAGIDAFFTDDPAAGRRAVGSFEATDRPHGG